jgi:two-component system response regulator RpfG
LLELSQRQQALKARAFDLEHQLIASTHEQQQRERDLLSRMAKAIGYRAGSDAYRDERISRYAGLLAEGSALDDDQIRLIEQAAPLHDIGNFKLPDSILSKPGVYSDLERAVMQQHTRHGHDMLRDSTSSLIQVAAEIALNHHEHWDGSGYPEGKAGEAIPFSARVVAIADVLDALTNPRSYRQAWDWNTALEYLEKSSGRQFDPSLIRLLISRSEEAEVIQKAFSPGKDS